ncbi:MAG TPA: hypothetical protein VNI61_10985 [Gemmatimonadales bacterium]|nr:hypothetical protein [Gemmatimonadales bacterium]
MTRGAPWLPLLAALLACDGGLQPAPEPSACPPGFVGICGTVRFRGSVPDNTDDVYVVAYPSFPQSPDDLFTFRPAIPPQLPLGDSIAFYLLPLEPGRYEWVLAVWKMAGTLTVETADSLLREAGFYRDPTDTTRPGVVGVPVGASADSIDFVVDFTNMRRVSDWFPGAPLPTPLPPP